MIVKVANKSQVKTCHSYKRPFGIGMLVAGIDESGTHLFETCPSANFYEYVAMAIGARCQSAKTYLEKNFENFNNIDRDTLIKHGIKALRQSAQEQELTVHNVSVGIVGKGKDEQFRLLNEAELDQFLKDT